ncbi:MAG: hypothetical protein PHS13_06100 [Firmicutes bacterium]|nr:hypothetical protein [Bacillota bacterium]MDD4707183.1 hypothetical protein [Bacillota bacterium]
MEAAVPMEFIAGIFEDFWQQTKETYNIYLTLLGMGIGVFCYFVDGGNYRKKGLEREKMYARMTGAFMFIFSVGLYIIVIIF